jgi:hypothetical protein
VNKYIRIGPSDETAGICVTSPEGLVVVPGHIETAEDGWPGKEICFSSRNGCTREATSKTHTIETIKIAIE